MGTSLNEAIIGSASNTIYFDSAKAKFKNKEGEDDESNVISGTVIAESPSLYSFMVASEYMGVPPEKISVTSVGARAFSTDKISNEMNPLDWFSRILALLAPVKKYTQDYFVKQVMKKYNSNFVDFQLNTVDSWDLLSLFKQSRSMEEIHNDAVDLISKNQYDAEILIKELVRDRFKDFNRC